MVVIDLHDTLSATFILHVSLAFIPRGVQVCRVNKWLCTTTCLVEESLGSSPPARITTLCLESFVLSERITRLLLK